MKDAIPYDSSFLEELASATYRKCIDLGVKHALANKPYIKKTIKNLAQELKGSSSRPGLVISGGPSLHRNKHIQILKEEGFDGYLIAADGAFGHCLREGVIPDFVVTVDPDPHRIIRWFGDPRLSHRPEDDYFSRQDIDPTLNKDEIRKNEETIELVNRYGSQIKLIISTSVTPEIAERALDAGMELYWWTPLYDDFQQADSRSKALCKELGVPCMTTGGNVGSSCWVFAKAVLQCDPVFMVGMDFSYPPGTEAYHTQYYEVLKDIYPDEPARGLIKVHNPHLDEVWLTDPAYYWYAHNFLQMLHAVSGRTVNCTEGGILVGDEIEWSPFRQALKDLVAGGSRSHG